jgi:hypothetical protein
MANPTGFLDILTERLIAANGLAMSVPGLDKSGYSLFMQATGPCAAAGAATVKAAYTLGAAAVTVTTGITDPDVYRCLQIQGNAGSIAGNVVISGTNWLGEAISDTIALNAASAVSGVKAFKTVTSIRFPAKTNGSGDTVTVGCIDTLGLIRPLAAAADVWFELRKVAVDATAIAAEALGTANATYDTVAVSTISTNDILVFGYLTLDTTLFPTNTDVM